MKSKELDKALQNPIWLSHHKNARYKVDGKGLWQLFYYPTFMCNKTKEVYNEPRAIMRNLNKEGMWTKEIPLRYLEKI